MTDVLSTLLHVAISAPLPTLAVLWWLAAARARRLRAPLSWTGPVALLLVLWTQRRHLRGVIVAASVALLAVVWVVVLAGSPRLRWALVVAVPTGAASALWWSGVTRFGTLPIVEAARVARAEMLTRQDLHDAVEASAHGARVVSVSAQPDGSCEAVVIGPAGVSHDDLVASLRDTLAESMLSLTGRAMESVSVLGAGAKGSVRVRLAGEDRYAQVVVLP